MRNEESRSLSLSATWDDAASSSQQQSIRQSAWEERGGYLRGFREREIVM